MYRAGKWFKNFWTNFWIDYHIQKRMSIEMHSEDINPYLIVAAKTGSFVRVL